MMVLQTSPLPLGYHTEKNVCLIYRRKIPLSIDKLKSKQQKQAGKKDNTYKYGSEKKALRQRE